MKPIKTIIVPQDKKGFLMGELIQNKSTRQIKVASWTSNDKEAIIYQSVHLYTTSKNEEIKLNNWIVGKCNNIEIMRFQLLQVTNIMPISEAICCNGIWTEGSEQKIIASTNPELKLPILSSDFIGFFLKHQNHIEELEIVGEVNEFDMFNYIVIPNIDTTSIIKTSKNVFSEYDLKSSYDTEYNDALNRLPKMFQLFLNHLKTNK